MRKVLKSSAEVFHFWANKVQSEGRAGNVFFEEDKVYSYGKHFCIARHLPGGVVVFALRGYSPSTADHVRCAKQAANHLSKVYCHDPEAGAYRNMAVARDDIAQALADAEKPRIRQTTRTAHKARALHLAERANEYLAALPEAERGQVQPIDVTKLEGLRDELIAAEAAQKKLQEERLAARAEELKEKLEQWRKGELMHGTRLFEIPPALRLCYREGYKTEPGHQTVETSHGAEIPVADAIKLWPIILRVKAGNKDYTPGTPLGVYKLTQIRTDGSIQVGCHSIAFSELEAMAEKLGLLETA